MLWLNCAIHALAASRRRETVKPRSPFCKSQSGHLRSSFARCPRGEHLTSVSFLRQQHRQLRDRARGTRKSDQQMLHGTQLGSVARHSPQSIALALFSQVT